MTLPVKGIEQSGTDCLRIGGQIVEPLTLLARQARWGRIEIASEIGLHCAVKYAAYAHHVPIDVGSPDPCKHLVYGVSVGEGVVSRLPVGVLIGVAEARHPKRGRVSEAPEVGGSRAGADRRLERVNNLGRIVTEQLSGERRMIGPPGCRRRR